MKRIILISFILMVTISAGLLVLPSVERLLGHKVNTDDLMKKQNTTPTPVSYSPSPSPTPTSKPQEAPKGDVLLSFAGDILLDGHVAALINQKGSEYILSGVKSVLSSSDLSIANLENPMSEKGQKESDKQYTFRAKPESVKVLTEGGIHMVTLANNHILDYGPDALLDTLKILKANHILYAGAGEDADTANAPVYIEKKGTKIAFIASSHVIPFVSWHAGNKKPGVASTYDPTRILSEIARAKSKADIVIAYIHWGEEMSSQPVSYQKNLAKMYIDRGADIVIGSHPHVLQGLEFYKGKIIAYSLGNFIFTNTKKDTMILSVEIKDKRLSKVKIIPCEIDNYRPVILKEPQATQLLNQIKSLSFNIEIDPHGVVKDNKR